MWLLQLWLFVSQVRCHIWWDDRRFGWFQFEFHCHLLLNFAACDALQVDNTDTFDGTTIELVRSHRVPLFSIRKFRFYFLWVKNAVIIWWNDREWPESEAIFITILWWGWGWLLFWTPPESINGVKINNQHTWVDLYSSSYSASQPWWLSSQGDRLT